MPFAKDNPDELRRLAMHNAARERERELRKIARDAEREALREKLTIEVSKEGYKGLQALTEIGKRMLSSSKQGLSKSI